MATVHFQSYFANVNGWQGNLLDAGGGDAAFDGTGTDLTVTLGASSQFQGYVIHVTGSGFQYINNIATDGEMSGLTVLDPQGHEVLSVAGLAPDTMASDYSLFWANLFGWDIPDGRQGAMQFNLWSALLSGNDTFTGTEGNDSRRQAGLDAGNDVYTMLGGNDYVNGGLGSDTMDGGDGWDILGFGPSVWIDGASISQGITVRVDKGIVVDCWGFVDHISNFEHYIGSSLNDKFYGGAAEDSFDGQRGRDVFYGGGGNDWVRYDEDTWLGGSFGITADLRTGIGSAGSPAHATDGFGNVDRLYSIENVSGTRYDDVFIGAKGQNNFAGGEGVDSYNGGGGADWVFLSWRFSDAVQHGANVDMSLSSGQIKDDGFGNVETLISIENINGTDQGDKIKGSTGQNWIDGGYGKDVMSGGGGADFFQFVHRDQLGQGDVITDFRAEAGANQDKLQIFTSDWGGSQVLHLVNGTAAVDNVESFVFKAADHTLYWDADGTGDAAMIAVVVLRNVTALTEGNFELV